MIKSNNCKSIISHLHSIMTRSTIIESHDSAQAFPAAFIQMSEFILFLLQPNLTTAWSITRQEVGEKKAFSAFTVLSSRLTEEKFFNRDQTAASSTLSEHKQPRLTSSLSHTHKHISWLRHLRRKQRGQRNNNFQLKLFETDEE